MWVGGCSSYNENVTFGTCYDVFKEREDQHSVLHFFKKMLYLHDFPVFSERQNYIVVYNKWT